MNLNFCVGMNLEMDSKMNLEIQNELKMYFNVTDLKKMFMLQSYLNCFLTLSHWSTALMAWKRALYNMSLFKFK